MGLKWDQEKKQGDQLCGWYCSHPGEGDGGLGGKGGGGETWMDLGLILERGLMGLSEGYIEGGWVDERVEGESQVFASQFSLPTSEGSSWDKEKQVDQVEICLELPNINTMIFIIGCFILYETSSLLTCDTSQATC